MPFHWLKNKLGIALFVCGLLLPLKLAASVEIIRMQGQVLVDGKLAQLKQKLGVQQKIQVWGKDAYVDLHFIGQSHLRLKGKAELKSMSAQQTHIKLHSGQIWVSLKTLLKGQRYRISMGHSRLDVFDAKLWAAVEDWAEFEVFDGKVISTDKFDRKIQVTSGQGLVLQLARKRDRVKKLSSISYKKAKSHFLSLGTPL